MKDITLRIPVRAIAGAAIVAAGLAGALHLRRRYHRDAGAAISAAGEAMQRSIASERARRGDPEATAGKGWRRNG